MLSDEPVSPHISRAIAPNLQRNISENIVVAAYINFLNDVKSRVTTARREASLSANRQLILLYYELGKAIVRKQKEFGWGTSVIKRLSRDLREAFPDMTGLSERNLNYMRRLALDYEDVNFIEQIVTYLPWGHTLFLLDLISDSEERIFYMKQTISHGWSRSQMVSNIKSKLYKRQSRSINNFKETLSEAQSKLAHAYLKDPYVFDFFSASDELHEREIERKLVGHVEKFLLALGTGFAFIGRQYQLSVGGRDFFIDLLFYHYKLHCFVVVELKAKEFKPEHAGQMNLYLSLVDDILRTEGDNPTIGLILCQSKDKVLAQYALKTLNKPIGLAEYQAIKELPEDLLIDLPSIGDLESELSQDLRVQAERERNKV